MKTQRMKYLFLALVSGFILTAQEHEGRLRDKYSGGFGHGSFSAQMTGVSSLNAALSSNGYALLNPWQLSAGGGGNFHP